MSATGTVELSFSNGNVRFFEATGDHSCAGTGGLNLTPAQLYTRLKQGDSTYLIEATTGGTAVLFLGVNHSPPRPMALVRNIEMTREFITHDPSFELNASRSLTDKCQQRELMNNVAQINLGILPSNGNFSARVIETHLDNERMGTVSLGSGGTLCLRQQKM